MNSQIEAYERFKALHERADGFVMPNAWDGVSALLCKEAGFEAIGTSSAAIALSLGRVDAAHAVSLEEHIANAALAGSLTGLPVNGDTEDGFGPEPDDVARTIEAAIAGGLAGAGIEDSSADPARPVRDFDDAVARVRAAARASRGRLVLTGRTENFLYGIEDLDDTIRRLVAFAEAGADVLSAPCLPDLAALRAVVRAVAPKPVNVLVGSTDERLSLADLQAAGVKRFSLGSAPYAAAMGALRSALAAAAGGSFDAVTSGLSTSAMMRMVAAASPGAATRN